MNKVFVLLVVVVSLLIYYSFIVFEIDRATNLRFPWSFQKPSGDAAHLSWNHQSCQCFHPHGRFMQFCHFQWWNTDVSSEGIFRSGTPAMGDCLGTFESKSDQHVRIR